MLPEDRVFFYGDDAGKLTRTAEAPNFNGGHYAVKFCLMRRRQQPSKGFKRK